MDLTHFLDQRRPQWQELQRLLETVEGSGLRALDPDQAVQFATLYRRAASDLNQAQTFITGEGTVQYLNDLVARGFLESIGRTRGKRYRAPSPQSLVSALMARFWLASDRPSDSPAGPGRSRSRPTRA